MIDTDTQKLSAAVSFPPTSIIFVGDIIFSTEQNGIRFEDSAHTDSHSYERNVCAFVRLKTNQIKDNINETKIECNFKI